MAEMNDTATLVKADSDGITVFNPNCPPSKLFDEITLRTGGLHAMVCMIQGEHSMEGFKSWNEEIQDFYLYEMARRVSELDAAIKYLGKIAEFSPRSEVAA